MQENLDHYISKTIHHFYRKRLIYPILSLLFAAVLFGTLPILSVLFPTKLSQISKMKELYNQNRVFVSTTLENLKFTGYTKNSFHRTTGYYYYIENKNQKECCIILLSPNTCEHGLHEIKRLSIRGKILSADTGYDSLLEHLSDDLSWTTSGIRSKVNSFYLSEPDFRYIFICLAGCGQLCRLTKHYFISSIYVQTRIIAALPKARPFWETKRTSCTGRKGTCDITAACN